MNHILKPKTINYLNAAAKETEELFAKAVEYKAKYNAAKTNLAREMYGKKLKRIVQKLDARMALFSAVEQAQRDKQVEQKEEEQ